AISGRPCRQRCMGPAAQQFWRVPIFRNPLPYSVALAAVLLSQPAFAQAGPTVEIDMMTDYRVRGLSWSDGEAAGQIYVDVPIGTSLSASAQATTLRGADRHGGADAGLDLAATYRGGANLLYWYGSVV